MDEEGISMDEFKEAFEKGNMFASGIGKPAASPKGSYADGILQPLITAQV